MEKFDFSRKFLYVTLVLVITAILSSCIKKITSQNTSQPTQVVVKGKITWLNKEHILKNAYVYVYKDNSTNFKDAPFVISEPSNEKGDYSITLPAGKYYFVARKFSEDIPRTSDIEMEPVEFYSYYGGNPVAVYQDTCFIGFNCSKIRKKETIESEPVAEGNKKSGIKGIVTYNEHPLSDAYVFVFQKPDADFKGPVYKMSEPTDKMGNFILNLDPGEYYLLTKKKKNTDPARFFNVQAGKGIPTGNIVAGPLSKGDYFYYYYNNPIAVTEGNYVNIELPAINKINEDDNFITPTRIEGTVKNTEGKPVREMRVFAFNKKMIGRDTSVYISNITKGDGKYSINFPEGGLFFLMARDYVGRPPSTGDTYGYYFGTEDRSIIIKKNTVVKDIDINVWKIE